jgi:hypothetical protein
MADDYCAKAKLIKIIFRASASKLKILNLAFSDYLKFLPRPFNFQELTEILDALPCFRGN